MCSRRQPRASSEPEGPDSGERLALYRRAARALDRFCLRWTAPFCVECLEVTRLHHRGDPRADVELREGLFPGCCQAGVADALWVPGAGEAGRLSPELAEALRRARSPVALPGDPPRYTVRERQSGLEADGLGCTYLGPRGCRLADLKAPLCLCYACEPILEALGGVLGAGLLGRGTDDFAGSQEVLRAVVAGTAADAQERVSALEARLRALDRELEARSASGEDLLARWRQDQACGAGGRPERVGSPDAGRRGEG